MENNLKIKKWNYGDYSSDNYGSHCQAINVGGKIFYFSYDTVIAFEGFANGKNYDCVCENIWGNTTGKHLNWIEKRKEKRLKRDEFLKLLDEFIKG